MCGWQVKLCNPFVTYRPCLSTFKMQSTTWQSTIQIHIVLLYFTTRTHIHITYHITIGHICVMTRCKMTDHRHLVVYSDACCYNKHISIKLHQDTTYKQGPRFCYTRSTFTAINDYMSANRKIHKFSWLHCHDVEVSYCPVV